MNHVVFEPEYECPSNTLNLWTGWGVNPKKGNWSILRKLLFEALCDSNEKIYDYVMKWSAFMVQNPSKPAGVAICFQGGKGTGKGTFGRALATICGQHGLHTTSSHHLTGRFTQHLQDLIFLFADEAFRPEDRESENRLKGLITEPILTFEGKGTNPVQGRNMLHIMLATNDDWVIRSNIHRERRYLVTKVNDSWVDNYDNFKKLNNELKHGGYSAMLHDFKNLDITNWHPRLSIPQTSALTDQKLQGMKPEHQFWFQILESGVPPFDFINTRGENVLPERWANESVRFFVGEIGEEYIKFFNIHKRGKPKVFNIGLSKELGIIIPGLKILKAVVPDEKSHIIKPAKDGRCKCYKIPPLPDCRKHFNTFFNDKLTWSD